VNPHPSSPPNEPAVLPPPAPGPSPRLPLALLALTGAGLALSGWAPKDRFTWLLEVMPILIVAPILLATWRRFPLTPLLYVLIALHALVLMVGGHWTYAEVPLGFWAERVFHLARNDYDKLGHFAQGFIPAIAVREVLLRTTALTRGRMLTFLVLCVCLAVSAFYELVEWWTAVGVGQGADAFLGTQGYVWDTQSDMLCALIGAAVALLLLGRLHDRSLWKAA
jgi:putative membrane protein